MSDNTLKPWKVLSRTQDYECPVWNVVRKEVISSNGQIKGSFYVTETRPWVNILALDEQENVILVEQYRHGIEEVTYEIPAGVVDQDDFSGLESAKRELNEETGYESSRWTWLGKISSNPAIMNNWCDLYLAENCRKVNHQNTDPKEEIRVHVVSQDTFIQYIEQGKIHHALALATVSKWLIHQDRKS